ncbi:MAG: ABC transporter ATP-binding protein [Deltaproteobacteria bacterium]|nr:ABC transporter ATP-binding protein [Deltaproteobacteria bacterium]
MGEVLIHALRGVNLEVYPGEIMVLLGPSGSGKSTLLNIMGGLDVPSSGEVWFGEFNLGAADDPSRTEYRRKEIGFIFQFYNLIPSLTALENVELITEIVQQSMQAEEALKMVGLEERLHHFPSQLSGGEQQRVAVARAIVKKPRLLLCDEPTGALDHKTGRLVLQALKKVNEELGTTTIIITHNAGIADMADRVVHLADGKIVQIEAKQQKINPDQLKW